MKITILRIIMIIFIITTSNSRKNKRSHQPGQSKEYSKSTSYNYSNVNGKVSKDFSDTELDKSKDMLPNGKVRERNYGHNFNKKNEDPGHLRRKATSTDKNEQAKLGPPENRNTGQKEERVH